MDFSPEHMLLGDIGATNARLALLSNGVLGPISWFTVAEFPRFTDAVNAFLDCHCRQLSVPAALLAVAGPVDEDRAAIKGCITRRSRPTGFGALRLLRAAHLREGDYRPRPHQLIDRCPCQKKKPGGDHDSNIGDEPNQDRMQRVAHANPPTIVASCFTAQRRRGSSC